MYVCVLTEGCRLEGGDAVDEVLVAGDDRLPGAVAVDGDVRHLLGDRHVLRVHPLLHVDHVPSGVGLRHGGERLVDGLELAAAVLGDHHVGRQVVLEPAALEHPPVAVGHPLRDAVLGERRLALRFRCCCSVVFVFAGEQPAFGELERGEERGGLLDERQGVAGQLLAVDEGILHLGLEFVFGEAVDAGLLVRDHRAQ
uniref:Uncharacterized protein n=1 Tax=Oryza brachyantha TaxID=4533 RepID=J3MXR0_ORYBR